MFILYWESEPSGNFQVSMIKRYGGDNSLFSHHKKII